MVESIENAAQIVVLLACAGYSLYNALQYHSRTWVLLAFFCGSWMLADLYWQVCLVFYNQSPQISVVSNLSWYAGYLFLYMLMRHIASPEKGVRRSKWAYLAPVFSFGMAAYYMQYGQIVSNLIYAALMGLLIFAVIRRLTDRKTYEKQRLFTVATVIFCLAEYGMWTSSCFFVEDGLENPYYWFDILMTAVFPFFLFATRKAVRK